MSTNLTLAQDLAVTALKSAQRAADRRLVALITRLDLTEADYVPVAEVVQLLNGVRMEITRDTAQLTKVVIE